MSADMTPELLRDARKARRHARHRAALLDAAREVLSTDGLQGFTIARVAQHADVSKPSFYYYFRSREELIAAIADQIAAEEAATLTRAAYAATSGPEAVAAAIHAGVDWYLADLDRYRLLHQWPAILGTVPGFFEQSVQPRREQILLVIQGRLNEDDPESTSHRMLASLTLATIHGIVATVAGLDAFGADTASRAAELAATAALTLRAAADRST